MAKPPKSPWRRLRIPRRWLGWSRRTSFKGFASLTLYETLEFLISELREDDLVAKSQSIAFTLFISIFPGVLVLLTLLAYLPVDVTIVGTLEPYIDDLLPGDSSTFAMALVEDVLQRPRSGLLSISFVLALYFSSNGMMRLMRAFDKVSYRHTFRRRSLVRTRILALVLTGALGFQLILSLALITLGSSLSRYLQEHFGLHVNSQTLLTIIQYGFTAAFIYTGIAIVFRYGAATVRRFPFFNPGAFLATVLILLTSMGFALYVNNLDALNRLYGSIGTLLLAMIWLQLNILWILIGYELNASIAVMQNVRTMEEQLPADREG